VPLDGELQRSRGYFGQSYAYPWPQGLHPWVITETNGRWGPVAPLPGTVTFQANPGSAFSATATADVTGLSCAAPGQCVLAGYYASNYTGEYSGVDAAVAFVAAQVNGTWSAPQELPGPGANGRTGIVEITALSCGSPGNCAIGGSYTYEGVNRVSSSDGTIYPQAFVMTETGGVWGPMEQVPGLRALGPKDSAIAFMSCAATRAGQGRATGLAPGPHLGCTAIGGYAFGSEDVNVVFSGLIATSTSHTRPRR
jgi:hypothetical protein